MKTNCTLLDSSSQDISYLIWQISKYWQRGRHRVLDEFGLTVPQLEMLNAIYQMSLKEKEATQIILSQETNIDPMTTSTILRNLEKKGLIERRESKSDTRARIVEATNSGIDLLEKAMVKVKKKQDELFENIDKNVLKTQLQILLNELNRLNKLNN